LLPRLQYGLDVNVKFTHPTAFEFTEELSAFDLAAIPLFHGWLIDPADSKTATVLGSLSYNQLVEILVEYKAALSDAEANSKPSSQQHNYSTSTTSTGAGEAAALPAVTEATEAVATTDTTELEASDYAAAQNSPIMVRTTAGEQRATLHTGAESLRKDDSSAELDAGAVSTDTTEAAAAEAVAAAAAAAVVAEPKSSSLDESFVLVSADAKSRDDSGGATAAAGDNKTEAAAASDALQDSTAAAPTANAAAAVAVEPPSARKESSQFADMLHKGQVVDQFLSDTATQLT
jgi:MINDY deubiquitinase